MGFFTWGQQLENSAANLTDFSRDLSRAGARALCRAWTQYPNNVFAISPVTRGVMRSVCGNLNEPTPTPNVLPFPDGVWQIPIEFNFIDSSGNAIPLITTLRECNTSPWNGSIDNVVLNAFQPQNNNAGFWNVEVTGTLSGDTSPSTVVVGSNSFPKTFTLDESTFQYKVEDCNPPVVNLPDPITEIIDVDIVEVNTNTVILSEPVTVNIPVTNNSVELGVTVNVGGVQVNYDVGGITFGGGGGEAPTGLPGGGGSGGGGGTTVRKPFSDGDYIRRFPNFDGGDTEAPDEQQQDEVTEGEREIDEKIKFVRVTISTLPSGGRTQIYRDSIDTDYFAGYIAFHINVGGNIVQQNPIPVRKIESWYEVPEYATGYRIYSVNNARLKASEFELM